LSRRQSHIDQNQCGLVVRPRDWGLLEAGRRERYGRRTPGVSRRFLHSAMGLLLGAAFYALLAMPASAGPEHGHGANPLNWLTSRTGGILLMASARRSEMGPPSLVAHTARTTAIFPFASSERAEARPSKAIMCVAATPAPGCQGCSDGVGCCGQSGCCAGSGCGSGMGCGSGSCGYGSSTLVLSHTVCVTPPVNGAVAFLSNQVLAGDAPGPNDRPPRV